MRAANSSHLYNSRFKQFHKSGKRWCLLPVGAALDVLVNLSEPYFLKHFCNLLKQTLLSVLSVGKNYCTL